ncbi:alpha/beta fold hydrolase [Streptomyces prunicolor]|nr:alpha/beta fold hydrolase [Streptomyces prunicolor]
MIPTTFVTLDRLPLTPNGKIDYHALPAPPTTAGTGRPPRTPHEQILATLFAEILNIPTISIDDNFFELGGHSLLATRLISRTRALLGVRLSIRSMLKSPTVESLARLIQGGEENRSNGLEPVLSLRSNGSRPPLFCIHPGGGMAWCYAGLLRHVPKDHPVYGLQAQGLDGETPLPTDMDEVVEDYVARIRAIQPQGPYHLLGWSFGGKVAYALAARLQQEGEKVAMLTVIDTGFGRSAEADGLRGPRDLLDIAFDGIGAFQDEPGDGPLEMSRIVEILKAGGSALGSLDERTVEMLIHITENNLKIGDMEVPARFDGDVLFFAAEGPDGGPTGLAEVWKPFVSGQVESYDLAFKHSKMMSADALAVMGPVLARSLKERS